MKISVIAANEARDRQKLISAPLLKAGHEVKVFKTTPFLLFLVRSIKTLMVENLDIVIFMGTGPKELLLYGIVKLKKIPCVVRFGGDSLRDLESVRMSMWGNKNYLRWAKYQCDTMFTKIFIKNIKYIIVVNKTLSLKLYDQLRGLDKAFVIPQFCDDVQVEKSYLLKNKVKILTVANLQFIEKAKGIIWIIEQLKKFANKTEINLHFSIAGSGPHLKDIQTVVGKIKSNSLRISVLGYISDLEPYYRDADIFVYRSFHDTTPNVILESKKYGLPLLVNDCEEFRNIVEQRVSGLLFNNESDFYIKLHQMITDKEMRKYLGNAALDDHNNNFSITAVQVKLEKAINKIVEIYNGNTK